MPIPDNLKTDAEVIVYGQAATGGSSVKNTVNVFHFRRTNTAAPLSKSALDTIFQSTVVVPLGTALNVRWLQEFNSVRMINDPMDVPQFFTHAQAGLVAGDSMPLMNAVYFNIRTAFRGKSNRGSKHFGPLSEADTTAGADDILNAAAITRWAAVGTAMMTPLVDAVGNTWVLEVVSRKLSALDVSPAILWNFDATASRLNKRIGRLRRREPASRY